MNVLITGGTGSLGHALTRRFLSDPSVTRLCILSRDEYKHAQMAEQFQSEARRDGGRARFFLGDIRDVDRLIEAFWGLDTVVHAAALKRVDAIAYDCLEAVKTNILGTANVIQAAVEAKVRKVLLISSDKAVSPANFYGTTKLTAEMLGVTANAHAFPRGTMVSVLRYGNVLGSRGSALHFWRAQQERGERLTLTDPAATRFLLTLPEAAGFVVQALEQMQGGEVFVPVLPSVRVVDLLEAVTGVTWLSEGVTVTGLRPGGEKIHETLLGPEEATRAVSIGDWWVVKPWTHSWRADDPWEGEPFPAGATYASDTTGWRLSVEEIRKKIEEGDE